MPSGPICFLSPLFEGLVSDKQLVQESCLLEKLNEGDEIMADKGFVIQDMLALHGVSTYLHS